MALGHIQRECRECGNFCIPALVVRKEGYPGKGFLKAYISEYLTQADDCVREILTFINGEKNLNNAENLIN